MNVARVAHLLGEPVLTTGFLGGALGAFIEEKLKEEQIETNFTLISDETRNCIAIVHERQQTEILESGPRISDNEAEMFLTQFPSLVEKNKLLVLSGSLPRGLPTDYY